MKLTAPDKEQLQWSEKERITNMAQMHYLEQQYAIESSRLKESITQMEAHIGNLQDQHSKTMQELMVSNPVEYFQANFLKDYKLAEAHTDSI